MKKTLHRVPSVLFRWFSAAILFTLVYIVYSVYTAPVGEVAATARMALAMLRQTLAALTIMVGGIGAIEYTLCRRETEPK